LPGIKSNGFLPDLYERLSVTVLALPPLEDHRADIPQLAAAFIEAPVSEEAASLLKRRNWPGHVAELRAVCAMAAVRMAMEDASELLPAHIAGDGQKAENPTQDTWLETDLRTARESFERWYFENLTRRFDGNVSQMAEFAGMDRTALHRKLKSLKDNENG